MTEKQWMNGLERDSKGNIMCTLSNMVTVIKEDNALNNIVYNELRNCIDVKGKLPWKEEVSGWSNADLSCLNVYIEQNYGIYSPPKCKDALYAYLISERRWHPVKEFLRTLKWDGIGRLDTLLVDFLGAEDTPYVRAVTRKTFVAAVKRIFCPGIKFDTLLVLCGPQGIGKSTLFSKLGGQWYSDSMTISDMRDKTAAEKLQGIWLMELGELAGLKKIDVEVVKSFLSRVNDQYRPTYGQYVENHLRAGIIVGTTNSTDGFLRDITGNRRFWSVFLRKEAKKKVWNMTQEEIRQIWAEALHYYEKGEELYLCDQLEMIAESQQRCAMESDPRQGLIEEYLEERSKKRICLMEIWCECLGKERTDMKRSDAYELEGIIRQIGSWEVYQENSTGKTRIPGYGVQKTFVRKDNGELET